MLRAAITIIALVSGYALACSCDFNFDDLDSDFDRAEMVFRAKVVAVDEITYMTNNENRSHTHRTLTRATVDVLSTYKGSASEVQYVVTEQGQSACGLHILEEDDYVFFTSEVFRAGLCGGSLSARTAPMYKVEWSAYLERLEDLK